MRIRAVFFLIATAILWAAPSAPAQSSSAKSSSAEAWNLPAGTAVKDSGPRTYRFTVDYNNASSRGEIFQRQRLTGEYTRGLPGGEVIWKNVTHGTAQGDVAPFGAAQKVDFMDGFRYRNDLGLTMAPDFFNNFPPMAVMERNLVWDTGMIEMFGQSYFDHLKLNEPYHAISGDAVMPGVGTFHNRDVVLRWVGRSERNGQGCAVIQYQAFFNPIDIAVGGMTLKGRSDYWGEIWVSLASKQIEYGTLYESVVADMQLAGQSAPQLVNILRIGTLEPISTK